MVWARLIADVSRNGYRRCTKHLFDRAGQAITVRLLGLEPGPPPECQSIELRTAVLLAGPPFVVQTSLLCQAVKRGIQLTFFHSQHVFGHLLNSSHDAITVV